jgi:hypothetical protein
VEGVLGARSVGEQTEVGPKARPVPPSRLAAPAVPLVEVGQLAAEDRRLNRL